MPTVGSKTHRNPVYDVYFADPFVWRTGGSYYAIGTGEEEARGTSADIVFPILRSDDFFEWEPAGKALLRPETQLGDTFWAPAVVWLNGGFYLFYSVGHADKHHQLRVAISDTPEGPYQDTGTSLLALTDCPFAIDPHPFQDVDGRWYLFFARDFLNCEGGCRAGTALVAAPMRSMTELEGSETVILRARHNWQRFEAGRAMYGGVWDWHTLEGPCVYRHEGRYYCFYSGGRWENESYGVDYGVADQVLGPYSDKGNEAGPRVLRTVPGKLIGPGHNSVIKGPDGTTNYIIYHAWDPGMTARRMYIDELNWTAAGPVCAAAGSRGWHGLLD